MERRRYLRRAALADCLHAWLALASPSPAEECPTVAARGRVTAAPVYALRSSPHFACAAMDGIAVQATATFGASETRPVVLPTSSFTVVDTGDPLPPGRDAVVMIEDVHWLPGGRAELIAPVAPWQHVRLAGEDVVATEMVLPGGHLLRAVDIAVLLSCGVLAVSVRQRPLVRILPTGDEVLDPHHPAWRAPEAVGGAIPETNSYLLAGLVEEWGGVAERLPAVPDDPAALRAALLAAVEQAAVVTVNAGSSAGRGDLVPQLLSEEGTLLAHGVEIMPGKPAALAVVRGTPVLGVPGYPVSAWVVCEQLLRPLMHRIQGLPLPEAQRTRATLARRLPSRLGQEEFVRVKAARVCGQLVAVPLPRGASLLSSVARADAVLRIPPATEGLDAGQQVSLELLRPPSELEGALLAVGSHDLLLDELADLLHRTHPEYSLSSAHVGSLAGLLALQRGECHLAGTHLIDAETGEYNLAWLARFFAPGEAALIRLARREQGLMVPSGNPLRITTLADLTRPGVRYVNRQPGSGTRQLLDFLLAREGVDPGAIQGYRRELYTHLEVAEAVRSGSADAGLGIRAAAVALGLDFVPIASECYDLALRPHSLELPPVRALLALITGEELARRVAGLGGYSLAEAGRRLV